MSGTATLTGFTKKNLLDGTNIKFKKMAIGYKEMAQINLQFSEICFAAESEVEKLYRADSGE